MHQNRLIVASLLDSLDLPSVLLDERLKITHANDSFYRLLGFESGKLVGISLLSLSKKGKDGAILRGNLKRLFESSGEEIETETTLISREGKELELSIIGRAVLEEDDNCKELLLVFRSMEGSDHPKREGEEKCEFKDLFDAIDDPIFIISNDRTIVDANMAALKLLNLPRSEVEGKKCFDLVHEGKIPEDCPLSRMLETESCTKTIMELVNFSAFFEVVTFPIFKEGELDRTVHHMKDITLERRLMGELEKKEEFYRLLYEYAGEPIFTYDRDQKLIDVNNIACKLAGYRKEELLGKKIFDIGILHPEDEALVRLYLSRLLEGKSKVETARLRLKRHDGTYRTMDVTAAAVYAGGELLGITNVCHDVTELDMLLEQVKDSEEKYRAIAESSHAGVLVVGEDYRIIYTNSVLNEMLKVEQEDVIGHDFREFLDKESVELVADRYVRRQRGENVPSRYEFYVVRSDGERRLVEVHSTVVRDSKGKVKTISQILDITERKKIEKEKERLNSQLMHAQKMEAVGRLAGGMAHDFNNMLNVIMGYAELMKERIASDDPLHGDVLEILRAAEHSKVLTEKLLAFARSEVIEPRVVNLNETIEESTRMLRRLVGEDIDVKFFKGEDLWNVRLDPNQVEHILANLATNARDAIPGTGTITIETTNVVLDEEYCRGYPEINAGEYVVVEFSDSGIGMDREIQKRVFEPFFTTKEYGKGTGLGLSSVYGMVKQNGGLINVYSEPNRGTTFKIYFPRHEGEETKVVSKPRIPAETLSGSETILIVDDREQILSICKRTLERLGYNVLTARTPSESIELVCSYEEDVHLVIVDVILPEMNGRELAGRISKLKKGIKVLYMSGYTANAIVHRGILDAGINFLQKPFSPVELAAKAREVLDEKE